VKKVAKWSDYARSILGSEDDIQKSYPVQFKDKRGWLVMSNRKLLFLEEEGFISLKYNKALELPYSYIAKVNVTPKLIVILDGDGEEFNFTETDVNLKIIGKGLQDLIAKSKQ